MYQNQAKGRENFQEVFILNKIRSLKSKIKMTQFIDKEIYLEIVKKNQLYLGEKHGTCTPTCSCKIDVATVEREKDGNVKLND